MSAALPAGIDWHPMGSGPGAFGFARIETTVGQIPSFVFATGLRTAAGRVGGGEAYGSGWTGKPGLTWATPFGPAASDASPSAPPAR